MKRKPISPTSVGTVHTDTYAPEDTRMSRRTMVLGLSAAVVATTTMQPWSVVSGATLPETRTWRHLQFIQHGQGIMATVTAKPSGETIIDAHFSNGKRDGGGLFQVFLGLFDSTGRELAEVSLAAPLKARSLSPWARTRTTNRQAALALSPTEAVRIDHVRMNCYRYPIGASMMVYVKFGDGITPKGAYPKKPAGLPPYAPNVGYNGATRVEDMPRYHSPAPPPPSPRPGLDIPYTDPQGNVVGYL